jgi:hypothetical protein
VPCGQVFTFTGLRVFCGQYLLLPGQAVKAGGFHSEGSLK